MGGIRTFPARPGLALARVLDADAEYRLAGGVMRPVLRYDWMIGETRPSPAARMAGMISWQQNFPDNTVRSGHGRCGFAVMINGHRELFNCRGHGKSPDPIFPSQSIWAPSRMSVAFRVNIRAPISHPVPRMDVAFRPAFRAIVAVHLNKESALR
jgi:hypothetical protein